ncbi:MAG: extracellular solute-binding protein [Kiloniellales bacterium]|nr:extracellular solute-binding protein [Kiloniellales bacterium]
MTRYRFSRYFNGLTRRDFLASGAVATGGLLAAGQLGAPRAARAASDKQGVVRVWGEPGPYAGVAVDAMNEWATANAPGLKFEIETVSWGSVYVKLMTDLAAQQPAHLISVESPLAYQLMAEGLLEPVDEVVDQVGRDRMIEGVEFADWGAWKGSQYVLPAHHQPHLLMVRMDVINELGLGDPDSWTWDDLLNAARTIQEKTDLDGIALALGRNLCTDYHFASLLHSAGGRMFDAANNFEVAFDSPATVETLDFIRQLRPYMPRGALEYSFLQVVDAMVTGQVGMVFYWGRVYGRAAEEAPQVYDAIQSFNHAAHPTTGNRFNWNDFQGWCIPAPNNPYIEEVKAALAYYQTKREWLIRYCHSLVPNVSPVYKDVVEDPRLKQHPFFETKERTILTYYRDALPHSSNTGNELRKGVNPLAGIVHGRSILAQTVQKVVLDGTSPAEAAQWGAKELEQVRKEHLRLVL